MPALRAIYRTAWELPMRSLIDMAADRGAFIDYRADDLHPGNLTQYFPQAFGEQL